MTKRLPIIVRHLSIRASFVIGASLFLERHYPTPQAFGSPNACTQTLQLHDLAVVDKKVYVCAIVFNVPCEYVGIGRLEHQFVHSDLDVFAWYVKNYGAD